MAPPSSCIASAKYGGRRGARHSDAVVYRGEEFIRHRGDMQAGTPGPPTDATLYEIGSLSKTLAGTLMANAVLDRKLGLDDDVRMYLDDAYPNLQYKGEPIRIRHLLSHTSGLPNMLQYLKFELANGPVVTESHRTLVTFDPEFSIGYFWNIVSGDAVKGVYYAHHGGVPRSQCYIYIIPKYDLGIFVITNQSGDQTARHMETAITTLVERIAAREAVAGQGLSDSVTPAR